MQITSQPHPRRGVGVPGVRPINALGRLAGRHTAMDAHIAMGGRKMRRVRTAFGICVRLDLLLRLRLGHADIGLILSL